MAADGEKNDTNTDIFEGFLDDSMQGQEGGEEGIKDNSNFEPGRPEARAEEEEAENMPAVCVPIPEAHVEMWYQWLDSGNKT